MQNEKERRSDEESENISSEVIVAMNGPAMGKITETVFKNKDDIPDFKGSKINPEIQKLYTEALQKCIKGYVQTGKNQIIIVYSGIQGIKFGTGVYASELNEEQSEIYIVENIIKKAKDMTVNEIVHVAKINKGIVEMDGIPSMKIRKFGKNNYRIQEL